MNHGNSPYPISNFEPAVQASQSAMFGGAAGTGVAWALSLDLIIGLSGLFIAFVGLCFNVYFRIKADRRQQALHELQLERLKHLEEAARTAAQESTAGSKEDG